MRNSWNGLPRLIAFGLIFACLFSCANKQGEQKTVANMEQELDKIDSLLRDQDFTYLMAETLDAAYYTGVGKPVPPFISKEEENAVLTKSAKEEKIATNIAGFYALDAGLNYLCNQTKETPVVWLQRIATGGLDSNTNLILNRFANATWKAGQPFRELSRITREIFTPFYFLNEAEIDKDLVQVKAAAVRLLKELEVK